MKRTAVVADSEASGQPANATIIVGKLFPGSS